MPAPPRSPPAASKPTVSTTKTTPSNPPASKPPTTKREKIDAIARGELTWAQAIGLTRTEAYGIAFAAHRLFEFGQTDRAVKILEGLIVMNPKDAYFPALLGGIRGRQGKEEDALALYTTSVKLDPNNLTARVNRADLLLRKGQLDKALNDLVVATKLDPRGKTPLGKRALALARSTSAALHAVLAKRAKRK